MATNGKAKKPKAKRNGSIALDRKITILVKENPKRPKAATYKVYALYKNGITVKQFIDAGGSMPHLKFDLLRKYIALS